MPVELFGGISIGDIAGIGALIASPLIFWVGYRRTTRTEDLKTISDEMNKIDTLSEDIKRFGLEHPL